MNRESVTWIGQHIAENKFHGFPLPVEGILVFTGGKFKITQMLRAASAATP